MTTFADRLQAVIGTEAAHSWATRHELPPPKVWDWIRHSRSPRRPQLAELAEKTRIPLEWWESGELPPPAPGIVYLKDADNPMPARQLLSPQAAAARINVDALAAIIEGALKTAPGASPAALAAHCAKIYAQALDDGLITATGAGSAGRGDGV